MKTEINTKRIGSFLKETNGADYLYLEHCMTIRNSIQNLIKRHELSKKDFCQMFKISGRRYNDYTLGNYNYSVHDMAKLNAAFMELEIEKLAEKVPIKIK